MAGYGDTPIDEAIDEAGGGTDNTSYTNLELLHWTTSGGKIASSGYTPSSFATAGHTHLRSAITNTPWPVGEGGTSLSTIAAGSVFIANTLDTVTALTSTSGTKVLTNTDGTMTWETGGSSSPGGDDTHIQFNDGGSAFGGSANLTWDDAKFKVISPTSETATSVTGLIVRADSSGDMADGFGGQITLGGSDSGWIYDVWATISAFRDGGDTSGGLKIGVTNSDTHYNALQIDADRDITFTLGDAAGAREFRINDSGNNPMFAVDSDGGITNPTDNVSVVNNELKIIKSTAATNYPVNPFVVRAHSTGNMADGFGGSIFLGGSDSAYTYDGWVRLESFRDGGDTSGGFRINVVNSDSAYTALQIDSDRDIALTLGDAAGAKAFQIKDSSSNAIFQVDSDGIIENPTDNEVIFGDLAKIDSPTAATSTVVTALKLKAVTSGNMADGFGPLVSFGIQDTGWNTDYIAYIAGVRANSSDKTGDLIFVTYDNEVGAEHFRLTYNGDAKITLGDAAGARKFSILDSSPAEVAHITSDGELSIPRIYMTTASTSGAQEVTKITAESTGNAGNDFGPRLAFQFKDTAGDVTLGAIDVVQDSGDNQGKMQFYTKTTGALNKGLEIDKDRNFAVILGDAAGSKKFYIKDSGEAELLSINSDGEMECDCIYISTSDTSSVHEITQLTAESTGNSGTGFGPRLSWRIHDTAVDRVMGVIDVYADDNGTNKATMDLQVYNSGLKPGLKISGDRDITATLGDTGGTRKFSIRDSTPTEVASINSDGKLFLNGDIEFTGSAASSIISEGSQNVIIKMGDAGGTNKVSFTDSGDGEVASITSDGVFDCTTADISTDLQFPTSLPGSPVAGSSYFNTSSPALEVYDGTNWLQAGVGALLEDPSIGTMASDYTPSGDAWTWYNVGIDIDVNFATGCWCVIVMQVDAYITSTTQDTSRLLMFRVDIDDGDKAVCTTSRTISNVHDVNAASADFITATEIVWLDSGTHDFDLEVQWRRSSSWKVEADYTYVQVIPLTDSSYAMPAAIEHDTSDIDGASDMTTTTVTTWTQISANSKDLEVSYTPDVDCYALITLSARVKHSGSSCGVYIGIDNGSGIVRQSAVDLDTATRWQTNKLTYMAELTADTAYTFEGHYYMGSAGTLTISKADEDTYMEMLVWKKGNLTGVGPQGGNGYVQYYKDGGFEGEAAFSYNDSTNVLTVGTIDFTTDCQLPTSAPGSPVVGSMYIDDSTDRLYVYVTGGWKYVALT